MLSKLEAAAGVIVGAAAAVGGVKTPAAQLVASQFGGVMVALWPAYLGSLFSIWYRKKLGVLKFSDIPWAFATGTGVAVVFGVSFAKGAPGASESIVMFLISLFGQALVEAIINIDVRKMAIAAVTNWLRKILGSDK